MNKITVRLKKIVLIQVLATSSVFAFMISQFWFIQHRTVSRDSLDAFFLYVFLSLLICAITFFFINKLGLSQFSKKEISEMIIKCESALNTLKEKRCISCKRNKLLKFYVKKMKDGKLTLCPVLLYLLNAYYWFRPKR